LREISTGGRLLLLLLMMMLFRYEMGMNSNWSRQRVRGKYGNELWKLCEFVICL
jgi:hypothetical protein